MITATISFFVAGPVKMLAGQVKFFRKKKSLTLSPGGISKPYERLLKGRV